VAGVEVEHVGGLGIEDEADRPESLLTLLPHLAGDVVAVAEIIAESLALAVQQDTSLTTES
jgi:GAF domain-containing protein